MNDVYTAMIECAAEAARVAAGIGSDRLDDATPCADWDVRTEVNHWVLYTSHGLEHRALRRPIPAELTEQDFTADPAWARAYAAQLDRAVDAWADPAVWEGEVDLGFTSMPAPVIAALVVKELAVHGWDVAVATGQEYRISPSAAELVLRVVDEHAETYRQYDGFAAPIAVAAGSTTFERALARSGRDPRWTAPVAPRG